MIEQFKARYDDIMAGEDGAMRDYRLAALMTDMEGAFNVPTLKNDEWGVRQPRCSRFVSRGVESSRAVTPLGRQAQLVTPSTYLQLLLTRSSHASAK